MQKYKVATGFMRWYLLLGRGIAAYTPWGTTYFINKKAMKSIKIRKHELKHAEQIRKEGIIKFGIKYAYFFVTRGYWNNPYEIECRKAMGLNSRKEHLKFKKSITKE